VGSRHKSFGFLAIGNKHEILKFSGFLYGRKYENGVYHRGNDMPAKVTSGGAMVWYFKGKMKRFHGLPCLITKDGTRMWFEEDENGDCNKIRGISLDELNGALVVGNKHRIL